MLLPAHRDGIWSYISGLRGTFLIKPRSVQIVAYNIPNDFETFSHDFPDEVGWDKTVQREL